MPVLLVYTHPRFVEHDPGAWHPEQPSRIASCLEGVRRTGLDAGLVREPAEHPDTDRLIARVHSTAYARALREACLLGRRFFHSMDNPISSATYDAARAAVSVSLTAASGILQEAENGRAFVIARPPGHHAEKEQAMGFCFFNNLACAAEWLREQPGIERLLILDWDVHHGNGTQRLFEAREDLYYVSIHRYPFYPGTGSAEESGSDAGQGFTRNLPMPPGAGDAEYLEQFEREIEPLIDGYRPDVVLISCGFDAHRRDPLGGMELTDQAFGEMTRRVVALAQRHARGRILSILEGGYDPEALAGSSAEHLRALQTGSRPEP